jgi:hypothetical protein
MLALMLPYLRKKDISAYDSTSPMCRDTLLRSGYWRTLSKRVHKPSFITRSNGGGSESGDYSTSTCTRLVPGTVQERQSVVTYFSRLSRGCRFLSEMKEQRGRPKHRDVKPHVYSRNDKEVSHSLPLFEGVAPDKERVMSRSETFSNDWRSYSLHSLKDIYALSQDPFDEVVRILFYRCSFFSCLRPLLFDLLVYYCLPACFL